MEKYNHDWIKDLLSACYWGCKLRTLNFDKLSKSMGFSDNGIVRRVLEETNIMKCLGKGQGWEWIAESEPDETMISAVLKALNDGSSIKTHQYILPYEFRDLKNIVLENTGLLREALISIQELRVVIAQQKMNHEI